MSAFLFVDSRVQDIDTLLAGLSEDVEVAQLDAESDGVEQMLLALKGVADLDSIHVVSHGASGRLVLGSTILTEANLHENSAELSQIGSSLSLNGDILLYGCHIGAGVVGRRFVEALARYAGANVAASADVTGNAALNGNWVLEVSTGPIAADVPFDAATLAAYAHTLPEAGSLDTTFDGDGTVTTPIGAGFDEAFGVALQPDGRIVAGGSSFNGTNDNFALARYNVDGSLDTTFDNDGMVTTDLGSNFESANALVVQPDGRVVLAGESGTDRDFAVVRYNSDGSLDTTFDGDGKITTAFGTDSAARSLAVQPDGRIVIAGTANSVFIGLVRYNNDGSLDTTFDGDGKVTTAIGLSFAAAYALALQADGRIIVAGRSHNGSNYDFALARYNTDGSLDTTFDGDGKVTTAIESGTDEAYSVALQPDGRIVVAGRSHNGSNYDFALARYNTDGSLDTTFDGDGKLTTAIQSGTDEAFGVALQSDGGIVVAGRSHNGSNYDFALARYNADGSLDATFDGDGKLTIAFTGATDGANAVAIQSDGKIVAAGSANGDFSLIRIMSGGPVNLVGGPGDDTLTGDIGDDTLSGLGGNDTLSGGEGSDTADYSQAPGAVTVNLAAGSATGSAGNDTLIDIENVIGSGFSDTLIGTDGANELDGRGGADTMQGGIGNDTYYVDTLGDVIQEVPGASQDLVLVAPAALEGFIDTVIAAISFSLANVAEVENLLLAAASAAAAGTGNELDNVLTGNELNNSLAGLAANDTLTGLAGDDSIDGGDGTDTAVYSEARAGYTIAGPVSGTVTGPEGTDTVTNIERYQFADQGYAFDLGLDQAAGDTIRVIGAAFDGPAVTQHPDWVGIGLQFFDGGMMLTTVCELVASILGQTNSDLVTTLFTNVVGFAPDVVTRDGFVGLLQGSGGSMTQGQLLEVAATVPLNEQNIGLAGLQLSGVEFV